MAAWFECSPDTIERACKRENKESFAEYYAKKSLKGHISLRRKQYETAMAGNVTLLIWLGKQWLGQTEPRNLEITSPDKSLPSAGLVQELTAQLSALINERGNIGTENRSVTYEPPSAPGGLLR